MAVLGFFEDDDERERGVGVIFFDVHVGRGRRALVRDAADGDERRVAELRAREEALEVDAELMAFEDVEAVWQRPETAIYAPQDGFLRAARELGLHEDVEFLEQHARLRRQRRVVGEEVAREVVVRLARQEVEVDVAGKFLAVALLDGRLDFLERVLGRPHVEKDVPDAHGDADGGDEREHEEPPLPLDAPLPPRNRALPCDFVQAPTSCLSFENITY